MPFVLPKDKVYALSTGKGGHVTVVAQKTAYVPTGTAGAPYSVSLPSGIQPNDVVVVATCIDINVGNVIGYSTVFSLSSDVPPGGYVGYKRMGATPDTELLVSQNNTRPVAVAIQVFRGVEASIVDGQASSTGTSGYPTPPAVTTTRPNSLFIVVGGFDDQNIAGSVVAPAGFANLIAAQGNLNTGFSSTVAMASKEVSAPGSVTPGAFGGGDGSGWVAISLALKAA